MVAGHPVFSLATMIRLKVFPPHSDLPIADGVYRFSTMSSLENYVRVNLFYRNYTFIIEDPVMASRLQYTVQSDDPLGISRDLVLVADIETEEFEVNQ